MATSQLQQPARSGSALLPSVYLSRATGTGTGTGAGGTGPVVYRCTAVPVPVPVRMPVRVPVRMPVRVPVPAPLVPSGSRYCAYARLLIFSLLHNLS